MGNSAKVSGFLHYLLIKKQMSSPYTFLASVVIWNKLPESIFKQLSAISFSFLGIYFANYLGTQMSTIYLSTK